MAVERKLTIYSNLAPNVTFQPIAVENLSASSLSTLEFMCDVGYKLSGYSGEERVTSFLFQCLLVQRFNSVLRFYCTTLS